jgi:hypothetical protein
LSHNNLIKKHWLRKGLLFIFLCSLLTNSIFPQWSGDGTISNPFTGTLSSNTTWTLAQFGSGEVYVAGMTISTGTILTVSSGVIVFTNSPGGMIINGTMEIAAGAGYTSMNIIINSNGLLRLNSDEYGIASLIVESGYSITGSGTLETEIYLTGGTTETGAYKWHFISSPVDNASTTLFTTSPATLNLARFVEPLVITSDNTTGWIAFDGYVYNPAGGQNNTYRFDGTGLQVGSGYNYYCASGATRTVTGFPNTGDVQVSLTCGNVSGLLDYQGYNLIGNPFSSTLDWDAFYTSIPSTVDDAIYFTVDGRSASYVGGVATNNGTNLIVPMQGFFVKVNTPSSGISLTLPASARTHSLNQIRFKSSDGGTSRSASIPLVRLKMENQNYSDDMVVRFDNSATDEVDKKFDAYKFSKTGGELNIWSTLNKTDFSINAIPYPDKSIEIPLGIYLKSEGTYRIYSNELNKLDGYSVSLKDLSAGSATDLKSGGYYEFSAPAGATTGRFVLAVSNSLTSVPEIAREEKKFSIYYTQGVINILPLSESLGSIGGSLSVYDITGRKVLQQNGIEFSRGELKRIQLSASAQGIYIVEIITGREKFIGKVMANR